MTTITIGRSKSSKSFDIQFHVGAQTYNDKLVVSRLEEARILQMVEEMNNTSTRLMNAKIRRDERRIRRAGAQSEILATRIGKQLFKILRKAREIDVESLSDIFGTQAEVMLALDEESRRLPWELAYDGEFLCCKYEVGRSLPGRPADVYSQESGWTRAVVVGVNYDWDEYSLDYPEEEARLVKRQLGRKLDVKILLGRKATKEAILSELEEGARIFHFSGHGSYKDYRHEGRQVRLEVAEDENISEDDLKDVFEKAGGAPDLAFLNACQSAPESSYPGMADAFINQGASHLIGTFWSVYDQPSTDFVEEFYSALISRSSFGQALMTARVQFAKKRGGYLECATWPAFVHYGQPSDDLSFEE